MAEILLTAPASRVVVDSLFDAAPDLHVVQVRDMPTMVRGRLRGRLRRLAVSDCPSLEELEVEDPGSIESVSLAGQRMSSMGWLRDASSLISLRLRSMRDVTDLAALPERLPSLVEIDLSGCRALASLAWARRTPLIGTLVLSGYVSLSDLTPLSELRHLTGLSLDACARVIDLSPLAGLPELDFIDLTGCSLQLDLAPVAHVASKH